MSQDTKLCHEMLNSVRGAHDTMHGKLIAVARHDSSIKICMSWPACHDSVMRVTVHEVRCSVSRLRPLAAYGLHTIVTKKFV